MKHLLAADIGGTKTLVALAARGEPWPSVVAERTYASRDFSMLEAVIQNFMARPEVAGSAGDIAAACFAVAGPVAGNSTVLTNLAGASRRASWRRGSGCRRCALINDFAAAGLGLPRLAAADLAHAAARPAARARHAARHRRGHGARRGVAHWDGTRYEVHPSEAGHADFAPARRAAGPAARQPAAQLRARVLRARGVGAGARCASSAFCRRRAWARPRARLRRGVRERARTRRR